MSKLTRKLLSCKFLSVERVPITFGSPKTFEEALCRLPREDHAHGLDDEMDRLSDVSAELNRIVKYDLYKPAPPLRARMIDNVSLPVLKLMERWSFKRDLVEPIEMVWDETIEVFRSRVFDMIPAEELCRTVKVYKIQPELPKEFSDYIFVCVEIKPDLIERDKAEYMLAFLDEVEYEILIGESFSKTSIAQTVCEDSP